MKAKLKLIGLTIVGLWVIALIGVKGYRFIQPRLDLWSINSKWDDAVDEYKEFASRGRYHSMPEFSYVAKKACAEFQWTEERCEKAIALH